MRDFVIETILKTDEFSETQKGHFAQDPARALVRRVISGLPWWARPIARRLARAEAKALAAAAGIDGVPELVASDATGLVRTWREGEPLHLARPAERAFYQDAARLLRDLRRAGITHNDLHKPQNWLMTPDGGAALIDFQLARVHRRKGWIFRLMAYEDLRHMLKQKRAFAPGLLTPRERRVVEQRSLPGRVWRATGKRLYVAVTRGVFNWSDGEGQGGRMERDGPVTQAALMAEPGVTAVALVPFPRSGRLAGLYAFCEAAPGTDAEALARAHRLRGGSADVVQVVEALPRSALGAIRRDILQLVVQNRPDGLRPLTEGDRALARRIAEGRPAEG